MDVILKELTVVVGNRIRFAEEVMNRVLPITTTHNLDDGRTLTISLK
jgi:hypothetical protein